MLRLASCYNIRQPLCPVVGQRPQALSMSSPNDRLVLSSAISCRSSICPGRLSTAWLVSLVVFSCHGLQAVTREVNRSSLKRLICPAQDHFIFLTVWVRDKASPFAMGEFWSWLAKPKKSAFAKVAKGYTGKSTNQHIWSASVFRVYLYDFDVYIQLGNSDRY